MTRDRFHERFGAGVGDDGVDYKRMIDNGGTLSGDTVTRPSQLGELGETHTDASPLPHG